jgi:hypothetical protein
VRRRRPIVRLYWPYVQTQHCRQNTCRKIRKLTGRQNYQRLCIYNIYNIYIYIYKIDSNTATTLPTTSECRAGRPREDSNSRYLSIISVRQLDNIIQSLWRTNFRSTSEINKNKTSYTHTIHFYLGVLLAFHLPLYLYMVDSHKLFVKSPPLLPGPFYQS